MVATAALLLVTLAATISAHETREVDGEFEFVVGFMNEPAYVNQMNGIDLRISYLNGNHDDADNADDHSDDHDHADDHDHDHGAADDQYASDNPPVENAHQTLNATITHGEDSMDVELRPVWGQPGAYTADVIPTTTGTYRFHFHGEIDGVTIDETFTGGPDTFSEVASTDELEFPEGGAMAATDSNQAAAMGIAGVVAGLLGLLVGGVAYFKVSGSHKSPAQQRREARIAEQQRSEE
ncbi:MAG: hypothetical protein EA415_16300 [Sphaerobacteraceae bacterium]|nr:MAG: hypothetical protein EA415_16300 [Sphaerobacteraceae bacterium]